MREHILMYAVAANTLNVQNRRVIAQYTENTALRTSAIAVAINVEMGGLSKLVAAVIISATLPNSSVKSRV